MYVSALCFGTSALSRDQSILHPYGKSCHVAMTCSRRSVGVFQLFAASHFAFFVS